MTPVESDWARNYIGIPYHDKGRGRGGVDCWGLIVLVYHDEFGIELPTDLENYTTAESRQEVARAFKDADRELWRPILRDHAVPGDVVLVKLAGRPIHAGLIIDDGRQFIHAQKQRGVVKSWLDSSTWKNKIDAFYRHHSTV